jgi:hypothetical protein
MSRLLTIPLEVKQRHLEVYALSAGGTRTWDEADPVSGSRSLICGAGTYISSSWTGGAQNRNYYAAFWMRLPALPASGTDMIASVQSGSFFVGGALEVTSTGRIRWSNPSAQQSAAGVIVAGQNHLIEIRKNANSVAGYVEQEIRVDGVSVLNNTTTADVRTPDGIRVGDIFSDNHSPNIGHIIVNDDQGASDNSWPGETRLRWMLADADQLRDAGWVAGAGGTTSLFEALNNNPPTGVADVSATNTSQIKNGNNATGDRYDALMQTRAEAGVPTGAYVLGMEARTLVGRSGATVLTAGIEAEYKSGVTEAEVQAAPAATAGTISESSTGSWLRLSNGWKNLVGETLLSEPRVRLYKQTASAQFLMACFLGVVVEYTDTEPPQDPTGEIDEGPVVADPNVTLVIGTSDPDTTGYMVKVWGDVDPAADADIQTTEGASAWKPFPGGGVGVGNANVPVKVSPGNGNKTVQHKIKDPSGNETPPVDTDVELAEDATPPVVTIDTVVPDSTITAGLADSVEVQTTTNEAIQGGEVWVVADPGDGREGTMLIDDPALSGTSWDPQITEAMLIAAALGYGTHIVKVFVQDEAGNWSADAASPTTEIEYVVPSAGGPLTLGKFPPRLV